MKKMNNKGFAITTVLYSLLIMAMLILFLLIGNLSFARRTTSNFVNTIKSELNDFSVQELNQNITAPVLPSNMIPVTYDGSNWVKTDANNTDNEWYNYDEQKWANAITLNHNSVLDLSGNGNNGTINDSAYSSGSATINGLDGQSVDCGLADYDFGDSATYLIRAKFSEFNSDGNSEFFGNWQAGGGGIAYNPTSKQLYASFYIEDQEGYVIIRAQISDETYLTSQYNTFALTYDGSILSLYFNGSLIVSTNTSGNIGISSAPIAVGGNPDTSGNISLEANLSVSDVLIYDRALTASEISDYSEDIDNITNTDELLAWYIFDDDIPDGTVLSMDDIETMWVWIPRYSYTIASVDGSTYYGKQGEFLTSLPTVSLPGEVDIKFISTNIKEKGTAKYKIGEVIDGWYTPDAFTFDGEELSGIWVGKFETSSSDQEATNGGGDTTDLDPLIKPNVTSWRSITISTAHSVALKMNDTNNRYGFSSSVDTHVIKMSEWGVVAYLSQSKYGKLGNTNFTDANKEIYQNRSEERITGCSAGEFTDGEITYGCQYTYDIDINGTGASTTGNIYGIYDMAGGSWEYVMVNYNDTLGSSGFSSMPNSKYYDKYTTDDANTACNGSACLSHALSETAGWYSDYQNMISSTYSWLVRGGDYAASGQYAGIFAFRRATANGGTSASHSFRLVATISG